MKIQCNQQFGRYCIAGRDIKKGEIILKESPMVIGPKMLTAPVCLGCMKTLSPPEDKVSDKFLSLVRLVQVLNFHFITRQIIINAKDASGQCAMKVVRKVFGTKKNVEFSKKPITIQTYVIRRVKRTNVILAIL